MISLFARKATKPLVSEPAAIELACQSRRAEAAAKTEAKRVFELEEARIHLAKCDAALAQWTPSNPMYAIMALRRVDWARTVAKLEA